MTYYINSSLPDASELIAAQLRSCMASRSDGSEELILLCIGSDRMTGDCLGPYVGQILSAQKQPEFHTYGTLFSPIHALNLAQTTAQIHAQHPRSLIIAVDASLGQKKHLGFVTVENGSLYPGAGVQKSLMPVGDISITGIVNVSGILEQLTLQTTRLSTVISMAQTIASGILLAL